jgi:hypothetical protein
MRRWSWQAPFDYHEGVGSPGGTTYETDYQYYENGAR